MIFSNSLRTKILSFLGLSESRSQHEEIINQYKLLEGRIEFLESKIVEISRAVATVALVQANMIRELEDSIVDKEKKKSKPVYARKTSDDFTN